jgi:hypothetical protein
MADQMTTTKTTAKKTPPDPVADAVEALRQAMLDRGDDPGTVEAQLHAVIPNETNLVGNFADLQRLGAAQVSESGGISDALVMPPGPVEDGDVVASPAKDVPPAAGPAKDVPPASGKKG